MIDRRSLPASWRELRKVSRALTLRYERRLYLLADTAANRRLVGTHVEVFQLPNGHIEIRASGTTLPCIVYDRFGAVDQGALVENKRLRRVLQVAKPVRVKRDSRAVAPAGMPVLSRTDRS